MFLVRVHYIGVVVGWQVGKWGLRGNILACEHKVLYGNDLGRRNILEKLAGSKF
jgi:hypothetical protein